MPTRAPAPIELMTEADIPAGLALVGEAGWNQVEADWRLMLQLGRAFCVRHEHRPIATALILPYPDGGFGWISMVLVHGPFRGQGIATRLLHRAIADLQAAQLVPVLDATPAGRRVYEPLGFKPLGQISRWRGTGAEAGLLGRRRPDLASLLAIDRQAFGAGREGLLSDLLTREGAISLVFPDGNGFLLSRRGRTALQVGPVVAASAEGAAYLLDTSLEAVVGPVLLDLPDRETVLRSLLERRGFTVERPFTRMALGAAPSLASLPNMRVIAGPELG